MLRKRSSAAALIFFLSLACVASCKKQPVAPPSVEEKKLSIDVEWSGTTSQGKPIDFTIKENGLFAISADFFFDFGSCSLSGPSSLRRFQDPITAVTENKFSANVSSRISVTGMFSSDTSASGTLRAVVNEANCKGQAEATWTAKKK